ncbi:hypothetical protein P3X46_016164 [Hevea brasiliensis]|uniref:Glabrous enhancer-binding protein-like DBD domain-containing protein n=2 Tax=Hevea brasiliensis TaxID=3981 RepID=A0ABQ9M0N7_HEVBR|nr:hypothetical protein P3X46_016164 [Hevea brasiliensis]
MDSNPRPRPEPPNHLSLSPTPSASKLPVKRKTPHLNSSSAQPISNAALDFDSKPPPFKFHRIWTEPDEIRFLQGLLDSSSHGLSFPRDLPIFYDNFSNTMSQPYSRSQLSEKLRRLRKKFRVISSRLARGLSYSLLSPHDCALFNLLKRLWSPEFSSISPFGRSEVNSFSNLDVGTNANLVGVKVSFSPVLPVVFSDDDNDMNDLGSLDLDDFDHGNVPKTSEMNLDCDMIEAREEDSGVAKSVVAKSVLNVFDECLKDVQMVLARESLRCSDDFKDFERRWRKQRVAELDVFARRLRLVLENSVNRQSVS